MSVWDGSRVLTERVRMVTFLILLEAFNLRSSSTMKEPIPPAPTTAKEVNPDMLSGVC